MVFSVYFDHFSKDRKDRKKEERKKERKRKEENERKKNHWLKKLVKEMEMEERVNKSHLKGDK